MTVTLRKFIRAVLQEKAVSVAQAKQQGLALYVGHRTPRTYMLYDADALISNVSQLRQRPDELWRNVYAVMMIAKREYPAWNAAEVEASAARQGFGPLIYDIAMAMERGLTPDRDQVSRSAKGVWDFYFSQRKDVESKLLDDIDNPKTPSKRDDAPLHRGGDENPLNYAYFIDSRPNVTALLNNHSNVVSQLKKLRKFNPIILPLDFDMLAKVFFGRKYYG